MRSAPRRSSTWLAWAFAVLALGFLYALCTSRIGRTLVAIKQNEPLVRAQGISPMPYKLAAFAIAAAITGVAGGIYTFHLKIIDPLFLDFYYMQTFLIIVIIGGAGSFWGVVIAGVLMAALPEALRFSEDWRMIIYGAVLLAAMLAMPEGVAGWLRERGAWSACERRCDERTPRCHTACARPTRAIRAVDGVSFASRPGSMTGLIGPNGSGKSTTIDCISGFQKLDGGGVVLAGSDITGSAPAGHRPGRPDANLPKRARLRAALGLLDNLDNRGTAVRSSRLVRRVPAHAALSRPRSKLRRRAPAS